MKVCCKCGSEKPEDEFYRSDAVRGYLSSSCKECDRARGREYYASHPEYAERVRETSRKRGVLKTPEEKKAAHAAYMRQYLKDHPEKRERAKERARAWHKAHPERNLERRDYILQWHKDHPMPKDRKARNEMRSMYGLGPDDYKRMLEEQNHKCALCGSDDFGKHKKAWKWGLGYLSIDHCHKTNVVRGLLCHLCNTRLGSYEKLLDIAGEAKVKAYLAKSKPDDTSPIAPLLQAAS